MLREIFRLHAEQVDSDGRNHRRAPPLDGDHHLFPHDHNDDIFTDASDTEPDNVSITILGTPAHGRTIFFSFSAFRDPPSARVKQRLSNMSRCRLFVDELEENGV